jgi:hypothetical protein
VARSSSIAKLAAAFLSALVLAACAGGTVGTGSSPKAGGSPGTSGALVSCLNGKHFVVQARQSGLNGAAPSGVAFTLTQYADASAAQTAAKTKKPETTAVFENSVVDYSGNPSPGTGQPPIKLSKSELDTIEGCIRTSK